MEISFSYPRAWMFRVIQMNSSENMPPSPVEPGDSIKGREGQDLYAFIRFYLRTIFVQASQQLDIGRRSTRLMNEPHLRSVAIADLRTFGSAPGRYASVCLIVT